MGDGNSPVQPLDSAGGDSRLASLLATAKDVLGGTQTPTGGQANEVGAAVPAHLCPNCYNGQGKEVELEAEDEQLVKTTGRCPECGYNAKERLYF